MWRLNNFCQFVVITDEVLMDEWRMLCNNSPDLGEGRKTFDFYFLNRKFEFFFGNCRALARPRCLTTAQRPPTLQIA